MKKLYFVFRENGFRKKLQMNFKFDILGNLTPYKKSEISIKEFHDSFVDNFDSESSRKNIIENHSQYIQDFQNEISPNFKQWINGSFVTNRSNPNDIDLVNLVDFEIVEEKYDLIKSKFINREYLKKHKIDAYLVRVYPKGHKDYFKTVSDLLYWEHWFGHTKMNKAKRRFKKGFVELSFQKEK